MKRFFCMFFASTCLFTLAACGDNDDNGGNDGNGEDPAVRPEVVEMKSAFPFYDGFDESSGRYRLSIPMCTSPGGKNDAVPPYTDLLLHIYMKYAPAKPVVLPEGTVTPFYEDGRELPDLVYYIGRHMTNEFGLPDCSGSGWYEYTADSGDEPASVYAVEEGSFSIEYDAAKSVYTISGKLTDKTAGKTMEFSYTGNPKVFDTEGAY